MLHGEMAKYTDKQHRKAEHIAETLTTSAAPSVGAASAAPPVAERAASANEAAATRTAGIE